MEAKNCPRCGRLFTSLRGNVCQGCEKAEEESFQTLKEYIDENPFCTLAELAEGTKISVKRITQYIRDGRLEISKGMHEDIGCEKCGKPITRGRYCDNCLVNITQGLNEMFGKFEDAGNDKKESNQRMHTLGRSKRL